MVSAIASFSSATLQKARTARILCCITFHFVHDRLEHLSEVLRALSEFTVDSVNVVVVTNEAGVDEKKVLQRLGDEILGAGRASVATFNDLAHPYDLSWSHKEIIRNEFLAADASSYSHFIYLEDDIRFSFANFCYFIEAYDLLRHFGLLPSFLRVEWSETLNGLVASDCFWPTYVPAQPHILLGEVAFTNLANPYNPCFVLDKQLATEYVSSRSFDKIGSSQVCQWGVRERAAMGLCLENIPASFNFRYTVPIFVATSTIPPCAVIRHLNNNYAHDHQSPLGKIRLDALFCGASALLEGVDWWPAIQPVQRAIQSRGASADRQFVLVSHHDTIVYFDAELQTLRHGPLGIVPINLVLEVNGNAGRLVFLHAAALSEQARRNLPPVPGPLQAEFGVEWVTADHIALRCEGRYISAGWGYLIRSHVEQLRDWEKFGLIRLDTLIGIEILQRHLWKSHADHLVVSLRPQPVHFGDREMSEASALAAPILPNGTISRKGLAFGPAEIRLIGKEAQLTFTFDAETNTSLPSGVTVTDARGTSSHFSRI